MTNGRSVTVFSSPGCGACKATKEFLTAKGVSFSDRDIESDPQAADELQRRAPGAAAVPVIIVGDVVITGFDRKRLERALGLS